jgi:energy-coupling factor transport system permease protein
MHSLHPVVKLTWLVCLSVGVFLLSPPSLPALMAVGLVALLWSAKVPPWRIPGVRLWLMLVVAIFAVQAGFARGGEPVVGPVTTEGIAAGGRAAGRLLVVVLASTLFAITTEPFSLASALMHLGLPYRWGFALVTALRWAPRFRFEAHHVYRAQLARGVAYETFGPRRWWLILRHLCFPLLVSAMRAAHALSLSMEGRAFGLHPKRTHLHEVAAGRRDIVASVILGALLLAAVILS